MNNTQETDQDRAAEARDDYRDEVYARADNRRGRLYKEALAAGYAIDEYSPGDGTTRYRFFDMSDNRMAIEKFSYFAGRGSARALGLADAEKAMAQLDARAGYILGVDA